MKEKIISIVVVVLVLGAIGVFAFMGSGKNPTSSNVATVNGVEITKADYDQQLALAIANFRTQGVDVDNAEIKGQIEEQVLNDLINNELVNQGIAKAGITVGAEDVQAQYDLLVTQAGGQEAFDSQLQAANLTEAQLRENIQRQLAIQIYINQNVAISGVTATDEEVAAFYEANVEGQEGAPALEEIEGQIRLQIVSQKQQALINSFVEQLRADAVIETKTS